VQQGPSSPPSLRADDLRGGLSAPSHSCSIHGGRLPRSREQFAASRSGQRVCRSAAAVCRRRKPKTTQVLVGKSTNLHCTHAFRGCHGYSQAVQVRSYRLQALQWLFQGINLQRLSTTAALHVARSLPGVAQGVRVPPQSDARRRLLLRHVSAHEQTTPHAAERRALPLCSSPAGRQRAHPDSGEAGISPMPHALPEPLLNCTQGCREATRRREHMGGPKDTLIHC